MFHSASIIRIGILKVLNRTWTSSSSWTPLSWTPSSCLGMRNLRSRSTKYHSSRLMSWLETIIDMTNEQQDHSSDISDHTNDEKPGRGALDLAWLFITSWVPLRLTTALLPSWSELSVKLEYPRVWGTVGRGGACCCCWCIGFCCFQDFLKVLLTLA